eukprot:RCo039388
MHASHQRVEIHVGIRNSAQLASAQPSEAGNKKKPPQPHIEEKLKKNIPPFSLHPEKIRSRKGVLASKTFVSLNVRSRSSAAGKKAYQATVPCKKNRTSAGKNALRNSSELLSNDIHCYHGNVAIITCAAASSIAKPKAKQGPSHRKETPSTTGFESFPTFSRNARLLIKMSFRNVGVTLGRRPSPHRHTPSLLYNLKAVLVKHSLPFFPLER